MSSAGTSPSRSGGVGAVLAASRRRTRTSRAGPPRTNSSSSSWSVLGLAGVADDEVGPERGLGDVGPDAVDAGEEPVAVAPPAHAAQRAGGRRAAGRGRSRARRWRRWPRPGASSRSRRVQVQQAHPVHRAAPPRRRAGRGCARPTPWSRPKLARSWATSTTSHAGGRELVDLGQHRVDRPRALRAPELGMAQKPQARSQPSATFTYAHGAVGAGRGRLSRSKLGTGPRSPLAARG